MCALAVDGSKLAGTGLAKEQMVQIHVAWLARGLSGLELEYAKELESRYVDDTIEFPGNEPVD